MSTRKMKMENPLMITMNGTYEITLGIQESNLLIKMVMVASRMILTIQKKMKY